MTGPPVSPDCSAGKCGACVGDAWDHAADVPAPCEHACHDAHGEDPSLPADALVRAGLMEPCS